VGVYLSNILLSVSPGNSQHSISHVPIALKRKPDWAVLGQTCRYLSQGQHAGHLIRLSMIFQVIMALLRHLKLVVSDLPEQVGRNGKLLALFLVSQISLGFIQHGFRYPQHLSRQDPTLLPLAFKESIKIVISLGLLWRHNIRKSSNRSASSHAAGGDNNIFPLHNSTRYSSDGLYSDTVIFDTASSHQSVLTGDDLDESNLRTIYHDDASDNQSEWPTRHHTYLLFVLAGLYAVRQTIDGSLIRFADARTIRIIRILLIFFTAGQMRFVLDSPIPSSYWTSAMLQVCLIISILVWHLDIRM